MTWTRAHVPRSGTGAERALGSEPVSNGPEGVTHDGGVLWHHTGVQFLVRGKDPDNPEPAVEAADGIRDVLAQYNGDTVTKAGEDIVRCDISTATNYLEQDDLGRVIVSLTIEVFHRPERMA